jgi:hypothetical protein
VDFPAFTVCSAGFANQNLAAGFYKEYLNFLEEHDAKVNATPYYVASIFERYFEVLYQGFVWLSLQTCKSTPMTFFRFGL